MNSGFLGGVGETKRTLIAVVDSVLQQHSGTGVDLIKVVCSTQ